MHVSEYQFQLVSRPHCRRQIVPIRVGWAVTALVLIVAIFWFRPGELEAGWRGLQGLEMIVCLYVPVLLYLVASALFRGACRQAVILAIGGPLVLYSSALATFRNSWLDPTFSSDTRLVFSADADNADQPRLQHPVTCDCWSHYPQDRFRPVQTAPATLPPEVRCNAGPGAERPIEQVRLDSTSPRSKDRIKSRIAKSAKAGIRGRAVAEPVNERGMPGERNPTGGNYGAAPDRYPGAGARSTPPVSSPSRSFLYSIFHWRRARSPTAFSGDAPASPRGP
jgi:hypothetical protein